MATNEIMSGPLAVGGTVSHMNNFVLQAAVCESPQVSLNPAVSCTACQTYSATCVGASTDPCNAAYYAGGAAPTCNACGQDVCVARYSGGSCSPGPSAWVSAPNNALTHGQCVRVIVGYNFTPITFLVSTFLPARSCWVGDTTTHTICAQSAGRRI
jgi:hypothetical protein